MAVNGLGISDGGTFNISTALAQMDNKSTNVESTPVSLTILSHLQIGHSKSAQLIIEVGEMQVFFFRYQPCA
jgi:hypothetical protein